METDSVRLTGSRTLWHQVHEHQIQWRLNIKRINNSNKASTIPPGINWLWTQTQKLHFFFFLTEKGATGLPSIVVKKALKAPAAQKLSQLIQIIVHNRNCGRGRYSRADQFNKINQSV